MKEESEPDREADEGYDEQDDLDRDEMGELYQIAVREAPEN